MSKALLLLRRAVAACSIKAMVVPRFFLLSRLAASSSRSKLSLIHLASSHPYSSALHTPHAPQSEPFPAHKNASFKFAPGETLADLFLPPGVDVGAAAGLRRLAWSNVFVDPHAGQGLVREARFIKSSTKEHDCPQEGFPEFALVGHSNAGKSSLLNALVRRRKLANTSGRAGKTQVINHFLINRSWYIVDLPGYGSARAPTNVRKEWENFTKDYFLQRKNLVSVLLLVDASRLTKQLDLDYADWLLSRKADSYHNSVHKM